MMTRAEALKTVRAYFQSFDVESPGLNQANLGGAAIGETQIYFEYQPAEQLLNCSALIYKFQIDPKPGIVEQFKYEERTTDTGGGTVDYEAESRGLYLSRSYTEPVSREQFSEDLERLMKASKVWGKEVLDRVAAKVFHPAELSTAI